jgi:hypothetical protein
MRLKQRIVRILTHEIVVIDMDIDDGAATVLATSDQTCSKPSSSSAHNRPKLRLRAYVDQCRPNRLRPAVAPRPPPRLTHKGPYAGQSAKPLSTSGAYLSKAPGLIRRSWTAKSGYRNLTASRVVGHPSIGNASGWANVQVARDPRTSRKLRLRIHFRPKSDDVGTLDCIADAIMECRERRPNLRYLFGWRTLAC